MIRKLICAFKEFLGAEEGPTSIEYAMMAALVAGVIVGSVQLLGVNTNALLQNAAGLFGGI
jgi:Flp pilus assembly pilin Flp